MRGKLPFVQARALAAERNQKAAMLPDFEEAESRKIKTYPPTMVSRFFHFKAAILPLLLREICCSGLICISCY